jgi:hypothetical protein
VGWLRHRHRVQGRRCGSRERRSSPTRRPAELAQGGSRRRRHRRGRCDRRPACFGTWGPGGRRTGRRVRSSSAGQIVARASSASGRFGPGSARLRSRRPTGRRPMHGMARQREAAGLAVLSGGVWPGPGEGRPGRRAFCSRDENAQPREAWRRAAGRSGSARPLADVSGSASRSRAGRYRHHRRQRPRLHHERVRGRDCQRRERGDAGLEHDGSARRRRSTGTRSTPARPTTPVPRAPARARCLRSRRSR